MRPMGPMGLSSSEREGGHVGGKVAACGQVRGSARWKQQRQIQDYMKAVEIGQVVGVRVKSLAKMGAIVDIDRIYFDALVVTFI